MMTDEQFDAEIASLKTLGDTLRDELQRVDEGSTDEQIKATAPRSEADVAKTAEAHLAAAKESSLAEAKAYAESALTIFKMLAAAG